jgi:uncharacterized repeat protein (TIGR01451 family)
VRRAGFVAAPVGGSNPDGFAISQSGGTVATSTNMVVAGHADVFTVVVHALSSDANGSTITNTAAVTTTTTDDSAANDETSTVTSKVVAVADLAVTKMGPGVVTAGTRATYTIVLTNNGPSDAQNVVLSDSLPAGATVLAITPAGGNPNAFILGGSGGTVTEAATAAVTAGRTNVFTVVVFAPASLAAGANFSDTATGPRSQTHRGSSGG